jgi:hypothetical protein
MSKHTPGPWHQVGAWVEVAGDDTPDICTCNPEAIGQVHLKWDWETVQANARLIAAAPDMLVALRDCIDALEIHAPDSWVLTQARAVSAKATRGEQ